MSSIFGIFNDSFFQKTCDPQIILTTINSDISLLNSYLTSNKYIFIKPTDDIISLFNTYNDKIDYYQKLITIINNNAIGFNQVKIYNKIFGDTTPLLNRIDNAVRVDDFYDRIYNVNNKINKYFIKDHSMIMAYCNIFRRNNDMINRYIIDLINIPTSNYYNLFINMFENLPIDHSNKSFILYSILHQLIIKAMSMTKFTQIAYNDISISPLISTSTIQTEYSNYINNNINQIADSLYDFLYHHNLFFKFESNSFKSDNIQLIINNFQSELINSLQFYFQNNQLFINQFDIVNRIFSTHLTSKSYELVNQLLYPGITFNSTYLDVNLTNLLDLEQNIYTYYSQKFIENFKYELEALQYFSLQYKNDPLFFINSQLFFHNYWINDKLFNKSYIAINELLPTLFLNLENIANYIFSSVSFKPNTDIQSQILNYYINNSNIFNY